MGSNRPHGATKPRQQLQKTHCDSQVKLTPSATLFKRELWRKGGKELRVRAKDGRVAGKLSHVNEPLGRGAIKFRVQVAGVQRLLKSERTPLRGGFEQGSRLTMLTMPSFLN